MSLESIGKRADKRIYIGLWRAGRGWIPAGTVMFNDAIGVAGFSYFQEYVDQNEPPLNPATLNYRDTGKRHFPVDLKTNPEGLDRTFWELLPTPGDFASQVLISKYPDYRQLNKLHQLHRLGSRTVGGLSSFSDAPQEEFSVDSLDWLDSVRDEAVRFHMSELMSVKNNRAFLAMASYGGVRPKATFKDEQGKFWIAKFNLPTDPYDMAKAEALALTLSRDAGLIVPETKVITLDSGESVFLIERFDRCGEERLHGLSFFALAPGVDRPKDPTQARLAGAQAMATMMRRFSDFRDMDTLYVMKKLLLDLAINNTDNHLRNMRVILGLDDKWALSPMFDMTFNPKNQGHAVSPTGLPQDQSFLLNPELAEKIGGHFKVGAEEVKKEISKVKSAVQNWEVRANELHMSVSDKNKIQRSIVFGTQGAEVALNMDVQIRNAAKVEPKIIVTAPQVQPTVLKPKNI